MCQKNFCNFSLVTKKCEKDKNSPFFSNERHFEIWFPKKKTITFFWSKLSKLHKKDPILHVPTTFYLKQGETRTRTPLNLQQRIDQLLQICDHPPQTARKVGINFLNMIKFIKESQSF